MYLIKEQTQQILDRLWIDVNTTLPDDPSNPYIATPTPKNEMFYNHGIPVEVAIEDEDEPCGYKFEKIKYWEGWYQLSKTQKERVRYWHPEPDAYPKELP